MFQDFSLRTRLKVNHKTRVNQIHDSVSVYHIPHLYSTRIPLLVAIIRWVRNDMSKSGSGLHDSLISNHLSLALDPLQIYITNSVWLQNFCSIYL